MPRYKLWLVLGAILGGLAVAAGAFGAHGLEDHLGKDGLTPEEQRLLEVWETATRYQMYHALALLAVGWLTARRCTLTVNLAGTAMTAGTILFSGFLYGHVLGVVKAGWPVPIGGGLMIVGWICLAIAAWNETEQKAANPPT